MLEVAFRFSTDKYFKTWESTWFSQKKNVGNELNVFFLKKKKKKRRGFFMVNLYHVNKNQTKFNQKVKAMHRLVYLI